MTYKGHAAGGVVAAVIAIQIAPSSGFPFVAMLLAGVVGGWTPDLDAPGAYMSRKVWPLPYFMRMVFDNPITWSLAGREGDGPYSEPVIRRGMRAWFLRQWCVRLVLGRGRAERMLRACNAHRRPVPLSLRLYWNPLSRAVLGRERSLRLFHRMSAGRTRMRRLAGHRGISHTWALCLASSVALGATLVAFSPTLVALSDQWDQVFGGTALTSDIGGALGPFSLHAAIPMAIALSFALGYLSHILLDSGSKSGTRPHWPLSDDPFWILPERLRYTTSR